MSIAVHAEGCPELEGWVIAQVGECPPRVFEAEVEIAGLAERDPAQFQAMPRNTPVGRLDEVKAAKDMRLKA